MEFASTAAMFTRSCKAISAVAPSAWLLTSLAALGLLPGCHGFADLDLRYEPCVSPPTPFVEQFDDGVQGLTDRCWELRNVDGRKVVVDEDLVLGYFDAEPDSVTFDGEPPMLVRRVLGDFVLVTHVETTNATKSDFCGLDPEDDAAGIVVRGTVLAEEPNARAAFLLQPDFSNGAECEEDSEPAPLARALAESTAEVSGIGIEPSASPPFGDDGEGDIAVCRSGGQLSYFFRQPKIANAEWVDKDWKDLKLNPDELERIDDIGTGPLGVGVATTVVAGSNSQVQGAFNWVGILDGNIGATCREWLDRMQDPGND
jgi:hypothetical protein